MQRKAWSASAGQIYWSYQLRGNHDFLAYHRPTIRHVTPRPLGFHSRLARWLDGVMRTKLLSGGMIRANCVR